MELAIGRQLSSGDRRLLINRERYLTMCGLSETEDTTDIGDGGFNARLIEQAVDLTLITARHEALWKS